MITTFIIWTPSSCSLTQNQWRKSLTSGSPPTRGVSTSLKSCLWPPASPPSFPWFPSLQEQLAVVSSGFHSTPALQSPNWTYYSLNWLALTLSPPPGLGLDVISQRIFRSEWERQEPKWRSYKTVVPGRICCCIRWKRISARSMSATEPDHPERDVWPSLFSAWWVLVPADSFGDLDLSLLAYSLN